jgi:transposase
MAVSVTTLCPNCQQTQAQFTAQQARLVELAAEVVNLQQQISHLQKQLAAARKDSSTSSKPPSSDIVKPPLPSRTSPADDPATKRTIGGQPGHPRHERTPFSPAECNGGIYTHVATHCPECGQGLLPSDRPPKVIQQVDIQDVPLVIEEHRGQSGYCPHCQKVQEASLPPVIANGGLVGPRLTTLVAYLKGVCHASYSTVRKFLRDVVGVTISRSELCKVIGRVTEALAKPYEELRQALPFESLLNVDETGHRDNGERWWTWCFRAAVYTLFKIDKCRSAAVLVDVLGKEFDGLIGCDYYGAYRRFMRESSALVQFCLAHLIRDVKFLLTLPDAAERAYGERLRRGLRALFDVVHRREALSPAEFTKQLEAQRTAVVQAALQAVPAGKHSRNLAKRFEKHGDSYFRFITTPGLEPTNNLAEQAIRFVVIDRHITQGTRSEGGRQWCERIWTVSATCVQQGRSVFAYLGEVVLKHFRGESPPSLLPVET